MRTTHREKDGSREAVDGSAHVLIATDGPGIFPTPSDRDALGKGRTGQQKQRRQGRVRGTQHNNWSKQDARSNGDGVSSIGDRSYRGDGHGGGGGNGGGGSYSRGGGYGGDGGNVGGGSYGRGGSNGDGGSNGGRGAGGLGLGSGSDGGVAAVAMTAAVDVTVAAVTRRGHRCRDPSFMASEGHPPRTNCLYNASGYPSDVRRPQGDEKDRRSPPGIFQMHPIRSPHEYVYRRRHSQRESQPTTKRVYEA